jgi:hypothetical protein
MLIGGKLFGFLGIILAVPAIAVAKVFLMFLKELYMQSYFYHAGDIGAHETPLPPQDFLGHLTGEQQDAPDGGDHGETEGQSEGSGARASGRGER